jgi:hypothetical protein
MREKEGGREKEKIVRDRGTREVEIGGSNSDIKEGERKGRWLVLRACK